MIIHKLILGSLETNTYLLEFDKQIFVIDPAAEPQEIINEAKKLCKPISCVLLTHGHFDHCNAAKELQDIGVKIYMSETDHAMIKCGLDLAKYANIKFNIFEPNGYLSEGKCSINGIEFFVIETPGHTAGGLTFVFGDDVFCGDTLFKMSIGRTDLPTGDYNKIIDSVKKIFSLGEKNVFPGHGNITSIKFEEANNPYVKAK